MLGLLLATGGVVSGIESLLQAGVTLTGTGLMAWYLVSLQRELSAEREAHRNALAAEREEYRRALAEERDLRQKQRGDYMEQVDTLNEKYRDALEKQVQMCKDCRLTKLSNDTTGKLLEEHVNEHVGRNSD